MAQLEGYVSKLISRDLKTGKVIAKVLVNEQTYVVRGFSFGLSEKSDILAFGEFVHDDSFGKVFQAEDLRILVAGDAEGIAKYLTAHVKGLGPAKAQLLAETFGKDVFLKLETDVPSIANLPRFGKASALKISQAWIAHREEYSAEDTDALTFLMRHDLTKRKAEKIYEKYGPKTKKFIQENPYRIIKDLPGFSFKTADKLAKALGVAPESSFRIRAGILFLVETAVMAGSCGIPVSQVTEEGEKLMEVPGALIAELMTALIDTNALIADFSKGEFCVFLPFIYSTEQALANNILRLMNAKSNFQLNDIEQHLKTQCALLPFPLDPVQREAIESCLANTFSIVTGPPGSGKTTILKVTLDTLEAAGLKSICLAAPTGKAAIRMKESTGREARTLHRTLGVKFGKFIFNKNNQMPYDVIVLDEWSMADIFIAKAVFEAIKSGAKVIVVGDADQIPSVGAGKVLADMVESGVIAFVKLKGVYRQEGASAILLNAFRVNEGKAPVNMKGKLEFKLIENTDIKETHDLIVKQVRDSYSLGYDPIKDVQVITPMHMGLIGTEALNKELQRLLNPFPKKKMMFQGTTYGIGDKVIQGKNDKERDIFNGEIGFVVDIYDGGQALLVEYPGRTIRYDSQNIFQLNLAYAITTHRSQGSEAPMVVGPVSMAHFIMLKRNLLYTMMTRARKHLVLIGDPKAIWIACKTSQVEDRFSKLVDFLKAGVRQAEAGQSEFVF